MIKTKFCDVCGGEFPPSCFLGYVCADLKPHPEHPRSSFSTVRVTLHPGFTNGNGNDRCDICPDCMIVSAKALLSRVQRIVTKERSAMLAWKQFACSKTNDEVAEGANKQAPKARTRQVAAARSNAELKHGANNP